ncbi:MAG: hypothetical protein HWD92_04800 [Flavobacteriia bacterium]|nr:hypothetical protein [Flavobacteriia bacterium]
MKKLLLATTLALLSTGLFAQNTKDVHRAADVLCECVESEFSKYSFYLESLYEAVKSGNYDFDDESVIENMSEEDAQRFMEQSEAFDEYINSDKTDECIENNLTESEMDALDEIIESDAGVEKLLNYLEEKGCESLALFLRILKESDDL